MRDRRGSGQLTPNGKRMVRARQILASATLRGTQARSSPPQGPERSPAGYLLLDGRLELTGVGSIEREHEAARHGPPCDGAEDGRELVQLVVIEKGLQEPDPNLGGCSAVQPVGHPRGGEGQPVWWPDEVHGPVAADGGDPVL